MPGLQFPTKQFYLLGEEISSAKELDLDPSLNIDGLQHLIAAHFAIVEPTGQ